MLKKENSKAINFGMLEYPKRWEYTQQDPVKHTYENNSEAVKQWLETNYPLINQR